MTFDEIYNACREGVRRAVVGVDPAMPGQDRTVRVESDRIDLLVLHIERGCSCSDRALVELAEMVRVARKLAGQHESVASVALAEVERLQQALDSTEEEVARLQMVRDAAEREIQQLRATAITFTCHECGEFFDEPIQRFLSESGDPVLAPTLCVDCGHGEEGEGMSEALCSCGHPESEHMVEAFGCFGKVRHDGFCACERVFIATAELRNATDAGARGEGGE